MSEHLSGDSAGCDACQDEATDAYLNDDEPMPACDSPEDDGEGYCAICGHAVIVLGSPPHPPSSGEGTGGRFGRRRRWGLRKRRSGVARSVHPPVNPLPVEGLHDYRPVAGYDDPTCAVCGRIPGGKR